MMQALRLLSEFTGDQWGMVTAGQAIGLGVDRSTLHRLGGVGLLERVRRGVYASTMAPVTTTREHQAAWLALDPARPAWDRPPLHPDGGVLSHQSAARLYGLGDLADGHFVFTTPRRRTSRDPDLRFTTAALTEQDVRLVDNLPVTTPLRTICDLLEQYCDGGHIGTIIRQAALQRLVTPQELSAHIGSYARNYGVRSGSGTLLLEHLLAQVGTSTAELD